MQQIKYSFILPAFKARFFREAIDSILAQTYTEFELIIVNDASPEDLDSIVKSYDDPRIRYYKNEQNIGGKDLVAQWNHCLEYAQGEYVILASDDDVYFPLYLEKMDALVQKYPDVNVFRPRVQAIDKSGGITHIESFIKEYNTTLEFLYAWHLWYIRRGIPFYIFRKDALITIGGFVNFPLAWYSDDATVISLADKGVVASSEILFSFRVSGESISTKENNRASLQKKLDATDLFYAWYEKRLNIMNGVNLYDKFYSKKLISSLRDRKRCDSNTWTRDSTLSAILWNSIRLLKENKITFRYLLSLLYQKI